MFSTRSGDLVCMVDLHVIPRNADPPRWLSIESQARGAQAKFPAREISGDGDISSDWVRCENGVSCSDARANHGRIEAAQAV